MGNLYTKCDRLQQDHFLKESSHWMGSWECSGWDDPQAGSVVRRIIVKEKWKHIYFKMQFSRNCCDHLNLGALVITQGHMSLRLNIGTTDLRLDVVISY